MKKLMTILGAFFIASLVLTSCSDKKPSNNENNLDELTACGCVDQSIEAMNELGFLEDSTKFDELYDRLTLEGKPCQDLMKKDSVFLSDMQKCMQERMLEYEN